MGNRFGLLGERLSYSFSPLIHAELGDYEYRLFEIKPEEIESFLQNGSFDGLNVTIPYKKTVMPYCSALSDSAQAIGSVNTLTRLPDGTLFGDNTDYFGFGYLLEQTGADPVGGKALILGSGGSSLTVQAVLRGRHAAEIAVVSRSGTDNYENIAKHSNADLLINTTPVGMYPECGVSPLPDISFLKSCRAVIDLIYNPAKTELLLQADEHNIPGLNGLAMLCAQAKKAAEIFTGQIIPDENIEKITAKIARQTLNIALVGMPGCGKTCIGAALAKMLGRKFADTDTWVENVSKKTIPAIFAEDGETAFRNLETAALRELCKQSGLVIATGGGVVTRPENLRLIRQNAVIVYLDRDIGKLPLSGRPLSMRDGIASLAAERIPLYKQWSEHTVLVRGIEQTAVDIKRDILHL